MRWVIFPHRNDREWASIKYSFNPWVLIYSFRHFILNMLRFIAEFKTRVINTIVQEFGFHFNADRGLNIAISSVYDSGPATFRSGGFNLGELNQTEVEISGFFSI